MTHQILPPLFILNHTILYVKPTFLHKKRRLPALIHFVLGCQCAQRILPTQTKYPTRIVIQIVNNCLKIKNSPAFKLDTVARLASVL